MSTRKIYSLTGAFIATLFLTGCGVTTSETVVRGSNEAEVRWHAKNKVDASKNLGVTAEDAIVDELDEYEKEKLD